MTITNTSKPTLKEKVTNSILDKLDKDIVLDYVWECYQDEISEWVHDCDQSDHEDYRNDLD